MPIHYPLHLTSVWIDAIVIYLNECVEARVARVCMYVHYLSGAYF